jgi:hypothetical protein
MSKTPRQATHIALTVLVASAATAHAADFAALPDWSGLWQMVGPTVFDTATVEPRNGLAGNAGVRERPPYTAEWEAKYLANIELVRQRRFPDPISTCGTPHGFPRALNLPDVYEFVVRPEQTWIIGENGPSIVRIYTDGRSHPSPDDVWPTYTGDSVGRWDGATLVFDTIAIRGEDGTILDRTGLTLSSQAHIVTRLRKLDADTLEAAMSIDDPLALTATWHVTKRYRKQPAGTRAYDYACAENNRNPIADSGETLTLDANGNVIDHVE